jgi:hypothetical protein
VRHVERRRGGRVEQGRRVQQRVLEIGRRPSEWDVISRHTRMAMLRSRVLVLVLRGMACLAIPRSVRVHVAVLLLLLLLVWRLVLTLARIAPRGGSGWGMTLRMGMRMRLDVGLLWYRRRPRRDTRSLGRGLPNQGLWLRLRL